MQTRTLFIIGCTGKGGWQHTPDAPIYLASHRRVAILLWQEDCDCLSTRGREGGSREGERGENSSFNMAHDKESEWIQPTWTPQPGSPYLPFLFFSHFPPPIHPPFGIANQPMCFFTGEVRDKERGVGRISNLSMLFISIYLFHSWHLFISLSLHECMVSCLCTYECEGILACKSDKMNNLFVCELAQIALYWSVHSRDGWIQKILFPRNVCVRVLLRGFLRSVETTRVETTRWNLLKTLLG